MPHGTNKALSRLINLLPDRVNMWTEFWVTRGRCPGCDTFVWTNPGSPNVLCPCHGSGIADHARHGACVDLTDADEDGWISAIAYENGVEPENVITVQVED